MNCQYISLAPFQGITNKLFRSIFTKHFAGFDAVFAPFISGVNPSKISRSKFSDVIPGHNNQVRTIPQFISNNPDEITAIGGFLQDHGFDEMNWNMGCPFPNIANKNKGCGILPYPETVSKILEKVLPKINIGLSVKCRLGHKSPDELLKIAPVFNQFSLKEIIVHPRVGAQFYRGDVNIPAFKAFLSVNNHKVAYNGNIYHQARYLQLHGTFPSITHWMVGRGALINPFLASQIKGSSYDHIQKRNKIIAFHDDLYNSMSRQNVPEKIILGNLKAIWYYLSGIFEEGEKYFSRIKTCQGTSEYIRAIENILNQPLADDLALENYFNHGLKHV